MIINNLTNITSVTDKELNKGLELFKWFNMFSCNLDKPIISTNCFNIYSCKSCYVVYACIIIANSKNPNNIIDSKAYNRVVDYMVENRVIPNSELLNNCIKKILKKA